MDQSDFSSTSPVKSLNILYASSEAQPLIKTGGLADVAGSLPAALRWLNNDVRLILPAYPRAVENAIPVETVASMQLPGLDAPVRVLSGALPNNQLPVYLVDAPGFFDRPGNPYLTPEGKDWTDNPDRFALFCRAVVQVALNQCGLQWQPDIVHCNDWQTGLVPPLLAQEWNRPATVFTIHNLSYQGLFDGKAFPRLKLPDSFWSINGLEFHNMVSFIKGGIGFADQVTTVSPTYADEVRTHELGNGLDGLLRHLGNRFTGILNGIDYRLWDPSSDEHITQHYDADTFGLKKANKTVLQRDFGLPEDDSALVFGYVGRLVDQKGVDLILQILPKLVGRPQVQLVMLGSGNRHLEYALHESCEWHPGRVGVHIGYDEPKAHRIEAGCDVFLMPSRFEPCGLNQLYSLRYGTVPIVRRTGGLADTVIDANSKARLDGSATGFMFNKADAAHLWSAIERVFEFRKRPEIWWQKLATTGMKQDFSWNASAHEYLSLYRRAMDSPAPNPIAEIE